MLILVPFLHLLHSQPRKSTFIDLYADLIVRLCAALLFQHQFAYA